MLFLSRNKAMFVLNETRQYGQAPSTARGHKIIYVSEIKKYKYCFLDIIHSINLIVLGRRGRRPLQTRNLICYKK